MSTATRLFLVGGISLTLIATLAVGLTTAAIYRSGTISATFHSDDGTDVAVNVPAGLADVALALVPAGTLRAVIHELEPPPPELASLWPALRASYRELVDAPDFTLAEVRGAEERIRVQKRGARLVVDLELEEARGHLALPLRTLGLLLERAEDELGP